MTPDTLDYSERQLEELVAVFAAADGDDWSVNNLPGEIAWRAPYSDELAAAIVGGSIM
ncbi:MAG: hypothetical protein NAOJABEB_03281 [Steroidobacteraceae bacterium]|nr:hypothetical protein [Steroidobacteraceae bacterium]